MAGGNIEYFSPGQGNLTQPRPSILIKAYTDKYWNQIRYKYTLTQGATTLTGTYTGINEFQDSTSGITITYIFDLKNDLADGIWTLVVEVATLVTGGAFVNLDSSPSAAITFTSKAGVAVTPLTPAAGAWERYIAWPSTTTYKQNFSWNFVSTGADDYQGEYTITVRRQSDSFVIQTSTVSSSATSAALFIADTYKDVLLEYQINVKNRYGTVAKQPTSWIQFGFGTAPVASITTPTASQVLSSGVINLVTSATTTAARTIQRVEASIWKGTDKLWSKTVTGTWTSGTAITITDPIFTLPQSTVSYQYRVAFTDSLGIVSDLAVRDFTVVYTAIAAIASSLSITTTNYDTTGYVLVQWPGENLDTYFYAYAIERRQTPLDPNTGATIGSASAWTEIGRVYHLATSYDWRDYLAPANNFVEYQVRQIAIRDGQLLASPTASPVTSFYAYSDSYWLVSGVHVPVKRLVTNLVTNPAFRVDTTGWTGLLGTIARSTVRAYVGPASGLYTVTTAGASGTCGTRFDIAVVSGKRYRFSAWVYSPTGNPDLAVSVTNVANVNVASASSTTSVKNSWIKISRTVEFTASGTAQFYVLNNTTSTVGQTWNVGAYLIEEVTLDDQIGIYRNYFDGSTPGGVWTGTANASTSTTYFDDPTYADTSVIAQRLYNVTGDDFSEERIRSEMNLIGRGRYIERGDSLGVKGSLTAQIRDGQGITARQKRINLDTIESASNQMFMRNPFGDYYTVSLGDVSVARIPGTGKSEFVDVTIPYSEVVSV